LNGVILSKIGLKHGVAKKNGYNNKNIIHKGVIIEGYVWVSERQPYL